MNGTSETEQLAQAKQQLAPITNTGTYTVTLTVKDAAGNTATRQITVTVLPAEAPPSPPPAEASPMWIIGAAIAAIALTTAAATLILWKRRK